MVALRNNLSVLVLVSVLAITYQPQTVDAVRVRCGILSFFGTNTACKASCWLSGQKSGKCDDEGNCNCNEQDLDISDEIRSLLGGLDVSEYVSKKYNSFKEEVKSWELSEKVKSLTPSKCQIGPDFCRGACEKIGRVTGKCNADFTDCECSDEKVSAKQYALCVDDGICSLYCQRKGNARGECLGDTKWDCTCISKKGLSIEAPDVQGDQDVQDVQDERDEQLDEFSQ